MGEGAAKTGWFLMSLGGEEEEKELRTAEAEGEELLSLQVCTLEIYSNDKG